MSDTYQTVIDWCEAGDAPEALAILEELPAGEKEALMNRIEDERPDVADALKAERAAAWPWKLF